MPPGVSSYTGSIITTSCASFAFESFMRWHKTTGHIEMTPFASVELSRLRDRLMCLTKLGGLSIVQRFWCEATLWMWMSLAVPTRRSDFYSMIEGLGAVSARQMGNALRSEIMVGCGLTGNPFWVSLTFVDQSTVTLLSTAQQQICNGRCHRPNTNSRAITDRNEGSAIMDDFQDINVAMVGVPRVVQNA